MIGPVVTLLILAQDQPLFLPLLPGQEPKIAAGLWRVEETRRRGFGIQEPVPAREICVGEAAAPDVVFSARPGDAPCRTERWTLDREAFWTMSQTCGDESASRGSYHVALDLQGDPSQAFELRTNVSPQPPMASGARDFGSRYVARRLGACGVVMPSSSPAPSAPPGPVQPG